MAFLISKALAKHEHLLFTTTIDLLKLPIWPVTNQIIVIMPLVISEKINQTTNDKHPSGFYLHESVCSQLNPSQSQGLKQLYGQLYTEPRPPRKEQNSGKLHCFDCLLSRCLCGGAHSVRPAALHRYYHTRLTWANSWEQVVLCAAVQGGIK